MQDRSDANAPAGIVKGKRIDCSRVRADCLAECSFTHLPTQDYGFAFWNCVNQCAARSGC